MKYGATHRVRTGADEPQPGDQHQLTPREILHARVNVCWELLTKAVDADDAPPEVQVFLVMGLEAMAEAKELIEGRR